MNGAIDMGYSICIIEDDLKSKLDINDDLQGLEKESKLFLPWYWTEGHVKTDQTCFKWADYFVNDLHLMKGMGVRGYLITRGEEDDYYKYVISNETVKEYCGGIVFPKNQFQILKINKKREGVDLFSGSYFRSNK
jgi:hypothetical protein